MTSPLDPYRAHAIAYTDAVVDLCREPSIRRRLESGRGRPVAEGGARMHRHLAALVEGHPGHRAHFTVASLIARHRPAPAPASPQEPPPWFERPDLGRSYADAVHRAQLNPGPTADRLERLVRFGTDLLHLSLGSEINRLHSAGVTPDWAVLLEDLRQWPWRGPQVTERWLEHFYLRTAAPHA